MHVLDVGCGTGAITAGIARAVGADGLVVGVDRDASMFVVPSEPNLSCLQADVHVLPFEGAFDVVTAARTLQWVDRPLEALRQMAKAAKPGGWIVVLDYNHAANSWAPDPPASFLRFWDAFLAWRAANGWDNQIAGHLPALFAEAGIGEIEMHVDDEVAMRGEETADMWAHVVDTIGGRIAAAGFLDPSTLEETALRYREWTAVSLHRQTLCMRTVIGRSA